MKNKRIFAVVSAFLALAMLAGCGAPAKSPGEVVKTGIKNFWNNVDSGDIQLNLQATAEETEAGEDGKKDQTSMNFVVLGKYDKKDRQNLKFDVNLSGDFTYLNVKYDGEIALKMADKKLYLNLLKYPQAVEEDPQLAMLPALANKWYFIDASKYEKQYGLISAGTQQTPEQKQIEEELFNTNFFKNLKYKGKEEVGNISAYKYSGIFDKDAFYQFTLRASEINKTPPTEEEKEDLKKTLATFDAPMELLISVDGEMLVGAKSTITYKDLEQKVDMVIKVEAKLIDVNQTFAIEPPKDAVDLIKMFGGAF